MELDVEDAAVDHFEVDPVYENIAAPKYWDFGRSSPEDGAVDKWFEDPNTVMVESPASYLEPKKHHGREKTPKKARSLSGSPLRLRQKAGHPPSPGRAQRRQAIGPSPLHKSVLSLSAIAADAVSASPINPKPPALLASEVTDAAPLPSSTPAKPAFSSSPAKPALFSQLEPASDKKLTVPTDSADECQPALVAECSELENEDPAKDPIKGSPSKSASAAGAFAQAMGATLSEASQPLFMRRNRKLLEIHTGTGGARRVAGRDLPGPSKSADVSNVASLDSNGAHLLESSATMQENIGLGGQKEGARKPPAAPKPGYVRLMSARGRSLDDRSWKTGGRDSQTVTAPVEHKKGRRSENTAPEQKERGGKDSMLRASLVNGSRRSFSTETSENQTSQEKGGQKKGSLEGGRRSGSSARSSLGVMDENAKEEKPGSRPNMAPTAVGRLKGRKSESARLARASSPRVEKVRAAWKLRRSVAAELGGKNEGHKRGGLTHLLEARMNSLTIGEEKKDGVKKEEGCEIEDDEGNTDERLPSPEKQGLEVLPAPSSMEKAGQLLRRVGAAMGALLGSVSPLEKSKPSGGESKPAEEGGEVARMLQFGDQTEEGLREGGGKEGDSGRKKSFLAPVPEPKLCAGVDPEVPEVSPENGGRKLGGGRAKRQSLLQRLGGASRKLRERSHTPWGRARKDGNRKKGTPGGKGGNISHARPLAVRLTLKEKERRLAVARRMAKLEEDNKKHAVTMGWLRSSAAPVAALKPAANPAPPKVTQPHPFPLRTEERGAAKQREWQQAVQHQRQEEEAARIPHAHPLPFSLDVPEIPPKPVVKHSTVPTPFELDSVKRHEAARAKMEAELEREAEKLRKAGHFKARPASSLGSAVPQGAVRVSVTAPATEAEAFALHTDQRAAERREFDQLMADKIKAAQKEREDRERQRKEREEEEVLALRRSLVVRAQPMPFFNKPFKPRKSTKGLTVPHSPKFSVMSYQKAQKPAPPPTWEELFGDHGRP